MSIEVIKPGLQSSIQDRGRTGYMHLGVAKGGAMDPLSMTLANWLVGNAPTNPVLEICLLGPTLRFEQAVSVAVSGAKFELEVYNKEGVRSAVNVNQTIQLNSGDTLAFGKRLQGARAYMAVAATFNYSAVLGSCATHISAKFAGLEGRALQAGDQLSVSQCEVRETRNLPSHMTQQYSGNYILRCVPSVETTDFSSEQLSDFYATSYLLRSDSNRMGLRFDAEPLDMKHMDEMVSSGLSQGSVQLPSSGLPIISSVDGQTIGGYPRIANVISADLFALGQLVAGDKVNFCLVSLEQAHDIYASQQRQLAPYLDA
ncbi:biotin-dependent carboxyltransferase family protein [Paraglaciecola sp. 25GB23A]|uniref:5-oxoprolinase subunit C family protein n=1 Tax=Paraglaciecola sp. 25GB23A TaxID=3156068 RepID=UPI0032AFA9BF